MTETEASQCYESGESVMPIVKNTVKTSRPPNRMMLRRALFLLIVCGIVAFIVLGVHLYKIQIVNHAKYESAAI
jgi:hypothetical protein